MTTKLATPINKVLPKGGTLLTPVLVKAVGGWVEMEFDATVQRLGLTWLRAKDGFGDSGQREDWVADLPSGCLSVSRWEGEAWKDGFTEYPSFDAAVLGEVTRGIDFQKQREKEKRKEAASAAATVKKLEAALCRPERT